MVQFNLVYTKPIYKSIIITKKYQQLFFPNLELESWI